MSLICTFMHHKCTSHHRNSGGAIVPLQFGGSMYFPRACILAIYADHPACVECTVTGSGCPVCHTQKTRMHAPLQPSNRLRDDANMHQRRNVLRIYAALTTPAGCKKRATKRAGHEGVPLGSLTVWSPHSAAARCTIASQAGPLPCTLEDWVFGPHRKRDSVYQCCPQVPKIHGLKLVPEFNVALGHTHVTLHNHSPALGHIHVPRWCPAPALCRLTTHSIRLSLPCSA
jgi:hypothetical protein